MTDHRLIEDYIPIDAISSEARREKSIRKGHISTLHLWWARRPLVACRAAVYGALVPAPATPRARRPPVGRDRPTGDCRRHRGRPRPTLARPGHVRRGRRHPHMR
jgi:adenine-specific DNA methylase